MSQTISNPAADLRTIFRMRADLKFTPQRGQTTDSAPTLSRQLGHLRNTMAFARAVAHTLLKSKLCFCRSIPN
jgi:hypothetical protein